jgi:hypothetical protein
MVVEVAPRELISLLPYVVDSIRFFDSTPLPYQRQRPQDRVEDDVPPRYPRGYPEAAREGYLMEATGFPFI